MANHIYNWKRFWCPRTGIINLSDGGYLVDPDSEWGRVGNRDVVPFQSIAGIQCLALLGEPGIGKTRAMESERKGTDATAVSEGDRTFWLDLRSYGSEDRLVRSLFESEEFISWKQGSYRLHLFLDSLDECLLRIGTLAALLVDEFKKYSIERLSVRIACRSADWPNTLESGLKQLWGDEAVQVYELAPLRRVDVSEAAKANALDPDAFLGEIDVMKVVPLAIKPVTLGFLLNTYMRNRRFPLTQGELYIEGCRLLCEETSEGRHDARLTGTLSANQRMSIAARIAAITTFANRYAIWNSLNLGNIPEEDVTITELSGARESVDADEFQVAEDSVKETLSTGLFSARGLDRIGWAHHTYAEFLAARYLSHHKIPLKQLMNLIVHPGDPEGKLIPQLHETAAWLAGLVPDVFQQVMRIDPEAFLRSDVVTANAEDREVLVGTLLKLLAEGRLLIRYRDLHEQFKKLAHRGLAQQLRPYICDATRNALTREVAIGIAEACEISTLQEDLVDIVLDPVQPLQVRKLALHMISRIGDDEIKARVKPLVMGDGEHDLDDELKGYALEALWPAHISAVELFGVLIPPKRRHFIGAYRQFLQENPIRYLQPMDLPTALKWVEEQLLREKLPHSFGEIIDTIMLEAWKHLESPGVLEAFAKAALSRLRHFDPIFGSNISASFELEFREDREKCRRVLEAIVPMFSRPEEPAALVFSRPRLVISEDLPWMIERLSHGESEIDQLKWAQLIERGFDPDDASQTDVILSACQGSPILAKVFEWLLQPVELGSLRAQKMEQDYATRKKLLKQDPERPRPLLQPPPAERIAALLDECETGNHAAWWRLSMEMTLEPHSICYRVEDELESDLTSLPGWETADAAIRARILEAAKKYILLQDPDTDRWLGSNTNYRPAFAGYRALRLILKEEPSFIFAISADVWKRWASIILVYPTFVGTGHERLDCELVKFAYQHAPDEIIETLMIMIDKENRDLGLSTIVRKIGACWDHRLASTLLNKARDEQLKPECMGILLGDLLDHGSKEARAFAESLVASAPLSVGLERSRALIAAHLLMTHTEDAAWAAVWPAIQQDPEYGRELIETGLSFILDSMKIGKRLNEEQLRDLYVWLVRQYPYAKDPQHEGVYDVGPRERAIEFRDGILRQIEGRGTFRACQAIQQIMNEFADLDWLKWVLVNAQSMARRNTWIPLQPREIIKIASNSQLRLVQNGTQLLQVLIESLRRLEAKLQGETPASQFIWNKISTNVYQPKDEEAFSDYMKIHLDEDLKQKGIICNREVRIHRGERTDIHVDAVLQNHSGQSYDTVTAIIEVKGCWHQDLNHAMKTQLVDQYLKDSHCHHGLYLVGWFNCELWDKQDSRCRRAPKFDVKEAQTRFDAQAANFSKGGLEIRALVIDTSLH